MSSCTSYVSRTHDVVDDVTRWQSRSNIEIGISPSKLELERRSKPRNVGNANGYISGMFNFRYNFWWKRLSRAQHGGQLWKSWNIWHSFNLTSDMKKSSQKSIFMMTTSSMTSQGGLQFGPLYSFINKITFFIITKRREKVSSLNFLCISIMRSWLHLHKYIFMTSMMTSPDHKAGQILRLIFLHQYLNYSVDQKLKMSVGIFNFRYNFRWKSLLRAENGGNFENNDILNTVSIWPQIWKDRPKLCQNFFFYGDEVIDDVTGWPQSFPPYSCLGEVGSGSKLQGQCLVNKWKYHKCLSRLYMLKDDHNE